MYKKSLQRNSALILYYLCLKLFSYSAQSSARAMPSLHDMNNEGTIMRVAALEFPPGFTIEKIGPENYTYGGYGYEVVTVLAHYYKLK